MYSYLFIVVLLVACYWLYNKAYGLKVYWFQRPDCGHCKKMEEEWVNLERKLISTSITARRIDINDPRNKKISENFGVVGVPHIVKVDCGGNRTVYSGPRKSHDILAWLYE
jgi:glutaredoxin